MCRPLLYEPLSLSQQPTAVPSFLADGWKADESEFRALCRSRPHCVRRLLGRFIIFLAYFGNWNGIIRPAGLPICIRLQFGLYPQVTRNDAWWKYHADSNTADSAMQSVSKYLTFDVTSTRITCNTWADGVRAIRERGAGVVTGIAPHAQRNFFLSRQNCIVNVRLWAQYRACKLCMCNGWCLLSVISCCAGLRELDRKWHSLNADLQVPSLLLLY